MARPHVLAIDLGTSGPKVAVVSDRGEIAGAAVRAVGTLRLPPLGAEQDPEELWGSVVAAAREALAASGDAARNVVAILCVSQYSSVVPVDARGLPVGPLVLWEDGRGAPYGLALYGAAEDALGLFLDRHGAVPLPSGADSLAHVLHLREDRRDVYDRAAAFVEPMDYLTARLGGELVSNLGSSFMLLLGDNRAPATPRWDPELLALSGVDPSKLPRLGPARGQVARLLPDAAAALGLPAGLPIHASMNDTQAAAIGTGAFRPGRTALNLGTTSQVLTHRAEKGTDLESRLVAIPGPLPDRWLILAEVGLGGGALRHLVEGIAFANGPLGDARRAEPYGGLDAALAATPPGAGGVLYLPWLAGALFPEEDPSMRGGFLGLGLGTDREHLARAVVEGVAANLAAALGPVERFSGATSPDLALSGGGALSDGWAQILADATGRPLRQLASPRFVNALAAALVALDDLGLASLAEVDRFLPTRRTFEPRPELRELYARLADRQRRALDAVRPLLA